MADQDNHEGLINDFCSLTAASRDVAERYLSTNQWDFANAATEFYTAQEEGAQGGSEPEVPENYTGPRTLDGRPAPSAAPAAASSSRSTAGPARRGIATLGSMGSSRAGQGHDDDDDDDEDFEPKEQPRDLFAGGEKSGLAVQDPRRNDPRQVVNDIIKKARQNAERPGGNDQPQPTPQRFHGAGRTLGGDDAPSQFIPAQYQQEDTSNTLETRVLHLWEDGFSVEDGPLHRFDDPQNAADLEMIRSGRAPLHLMNIRPGQPVDVQLTKHDENYKPPPKKYKPFSGSGQRLGSPTPGPSGPSSAPSSAPATAAAASSTTSAPTPTVDPSQPTVNLRIQLADGTRLPARFNTTQTIGDVYDFISRATPPGERRMWVLATTFPNKEHTDKSLVLKDVPEFQRGGTAVQKWA